MRNEPDIVKILREEEGEESKGKLGKIIQKINSSEHVSDREKHIIENVNNNSATTKSSSDSEKILQALMNLIADPVVIVDKKGKFLECSDRVEMLTGYKKEDLLGKSFLKVPFITAKSKALLIKNLARRLLGEQIKTYEIEGVFKDGKKTPLEVYGMKVEYKGKPADVVLFRDVSIQKKAEKELETSKEKYHSLITNIPDVTWTTDSKGNTTFVSPNVEDIYGYSPEEIYSAGDSLWFGRIHPDDVENVKDAFKAFFENGNVLNIEYRVKCKDGKWIWLHDRATDIYEKDGVMYADGVFTDVTNRKKAEEELKNKVNELEKFQEITVDRELEMVELKKEINELCKKNGEKVRYKINHEDEIIDGINI